MSAYQMFMDIGEYFAAGLFEFPEAGVETRYANALKRFWEQADLPEYDGGQLYPCGMHPFYAQKNMAFRPHYALTYGFDWNAMRLKSEEGARMVAEEVDKVSGFPTPHTVGGAGWTHSFPNYQRVLTEGLNRYQERVEALPEGDFKSGMLLVLEGIRIYHRRSLDMLKQANAPEKLIRALERMPWQPPEDVYEALVAWNFIYYVDGCDDIGPLDKYLLPYYRGEDLVEIIRELFRHVDSNDGWSGTLGPEYNEITRMCIRAIHNGRRPNLQLLVKPDMPDWVWEEAAASLSTSCGQPALYNYELFRGTLHQLMPQIPDSDLDRMAYGGCTETMLEGISAVGSDDAGINTALVFDEWMREALCRCDTFESFFDGLALRLRQTVAETLDILNEHRRTRALYRPSVIRTLLVDDCIDKQLDFQNDGPRWVWSVINIAGLINVIDSLSVIRTLIYEEKLYTAEEFLAKMDARDPEFLLRAKACPAFGVDNGRVDQLGAKLADSLIDAFSQRECYPSGKFYPVSNQFTTYAAAGLCVGATPDGRAAGAPLCDSIGAIHGNDVKGPTAMLSSVAHLPLKRIIGTPITNIRIARDHIHALLKPLTLGYMQQGGMQLQVSCLSREEIQDAMIHPERHESLVVRIGGFSEYFNRLSPELKQTVLERTEH